MVITIFYILGLLSGFFMVFLSGQWHSSQQISQMLLRTFLVIGVGIPLLISSIGHIFKSDLAAKRLGWPIGNPFQKEVGFFDGAAGIISILSYWHFGEFLLATIIYNCICWTLAAILHVKEVIQHKNYKFDNVSTGVVDFLVPITLLILYILSKY
jgi:hypothetical protein